MKIAARYKSPVKAESDRAFLNSAGIEAFIFDEGMGTMVNIYDSNREGGIKLAVSEQDYESAVKLLAEINNKEESD
jgi:hypothetical protein